MEQDDFHGFDNIGSFKIRARLNLLVAVTRSHKNRPAPRALSAADIEIAITDHPTRR